MEEMTAAINASMTPVVEVWVNWMMIIFLLSLLFVYKHKSARIIIIAFVLTLPLAIGIFKAFHTVYLIGLSHIIIWGPLAVYLIKSEFVNGKTKLQTPYGIYLFLLLTTIIISLVLDVRDVVMFMLGMKI